MKAKSIKGKSIEEIDVAITESMLDGFKPTLAICFLSIKQDRKEICNILQKASIEFLGATSCGEFIDGIKSEGETVMLLMDLPHDAFTVLFEKIEDRSLNQVASSLSKSAIDKFKNPAFIICSTGVSKETEYLDGDALIRAMEKEVGSDKLFCGGMAGDDGTFTGTYIFTNGKETDKGIAAIVFDENKVSVVGMAISGWKPLGTSKIITKSNGNTVYTIDGLPAADLYLRYLGEEKISPHSSKNIMQTIGMYYPLILDREIGEPVLRTPMSINVEENALIFDLDMPENGVIRFSMPPDFDIVDKIIEEATWLKDKSKFEAEALLIFSCAGRLQVLGPLADAENEGLSNVWNKPMAGFFTYGEYGKTKNGRPEFHSGTISWVAIKEK